MLSLPLPKNIIISSTLKLSKITNIDNSQIKKIELNSISIIKTGEGLRLFFKKDSISNSRIMSSIYQLRKGFSIGWQKHLRLVGVGFRATIIDVSFQKEYIRSEYIIKNYLRKRILYLTDNHPSLKNKFLKLKIGFSHEVIYPIRIINQKHIKVSSIEGRTKGILINIKSNDKYELNQMIIEIRSFRYPETYKNKGIYFNKEIVKLKKGKRQN